MRVGLGFLAVILAFQPLLMGGAAAFAPVSPQDEGQLNRFAPQDSVFLADSLSASDTLALSFRPVRTGAPFLADLRQQSPMQPNETLRAIWVVRDALTSRAEIDRMVDFAIATRMHLVFAQVRGRGDAYYHSSLVPINDRLEVPLDQFDPLRYLLYRCHAAGIAVHAWVNCFYVWSSEDQDPPAQHVVKTNPEWLLHDRDGNRMDVFGIGEWLQRGDTEGYYIDPAYPEVRRHLADVIRELVTTYDVDGVHLDYVRYPNNDVGYSPAMRAEVITRFGVDPATPPFAAARNLGPAAAAWVDSVVVARRLSNVDSTVAAIRDAIGDLPLSAAGVPDPEVAARHKGQDWRGWIYRGWLDFVVPMAYNDRPRDIRRRLRYLENAVGSDRWLMGVAVYGGREVYAQGNINEVRRIGTGGVALFSYNVMAEGRFAAKFVNEAFFGSAGDN